MLFHNWKYRVFPSASGAEWNGKKSKEREVYTVYTVALKSLHSLAEFGIEIENGLLFRAIDHMK